MPAAQAQKTKPKKPKAQDWLEAMLDMLGPKVDVLGLLASMVPQMPEAPKGEVSILDALMYAAQMPGVIPQGATVYHGTPHRFAPTAKNKFGEFDLSKMGTGDGSRAYGWGAYLAENPSVGNVYRKGDSGLLYRVDLPDEHIARMLDWDAPISQQPEAVQRAINLARKKEFSDWGSNSFDKWITDPETIGANMYGAIRGGGKESSMALSEYGIPGLKYRAGTRNYVVWEPSILEILGIE